MVVVKWADLSVPYFWDEFGYAPPAHWLFENGLHRVLPGLHPPETFLGHIPGFSWLLAVGYKIFGYHFEVARLLALTFTLVQIYFTYSLASWIGGRWAGFLAAVVLVSIPMVFSHATQTQADGPVASFGIAACYFACTRKDTKYFWTACVLALLKETALAVVLPIFLVRMAQAKLRKESLTGVAFRYGTPVSLIALFFVSEKVFTGKFTNFPFMSTLSISPSVLLPRAWNYFVYIFWYNQNSWLLTSIALAGIFICLVQRRPEVRWAVGFLVPVWICVWLGVSCFSAINPRYFLTTFPILCVLGLGGTAVVLKRFTPVFGFAVAYWVSISVSQYYGTDSFLGSAQEDTMQYRDVVKAHQEAVRYLETFHSDKRIYAVWPLDAELSDFRMGYVRVGLKAVSTPQSIDAYDLVVTAESSAPLLLAAQLDAVRNYWLELEKEFLVNGKSVKIWRKPQKSEE